MAVEFGRLESVELNRAWKHEASDFTPWLAENLDRLSEEIGIPIETIQLEKRVAGQFSADIFARNTTNDSFVLIENQLKGSDHSHLGQVLTYLAGLDAKTVIWVAESFQEAHLSAIRWLNEHTESEFSFFAVQVSVSRVAGYDDSPLIPGFEVLARPSGWERQLREERRGAQHEFVQFCREFWRYYAERYPDDGAREEAASSSMRYEFQDQGLTVVQSLAKAYVGMFLSGRANESREELLMLVRLFEPHLQKEFDIDTGTPEFSNSGAYHLGKLQIDTDNRDNWECMAEWLHKGLETCQDIFEVTRPSAFDVEETNYHKA